MRSAAGTVLADDNYRGANDNYAPANDTFTNLATTGRNSCRRPAGVVDVDQAFMPSKDNQQVPSPSREASRRIRRSRSVAHVRRFEIPRAGRTQR